MDESFTDVIIRLESEKVNNATLLEHIKSFEPIREDTANQMKAASKEFRKNFKLRNVQL